MFTKSRPTTRQAAKVIVPVRPAAGPEQGPGTVTRDLASRRTFGRYQPSRRTFGRFTPSRRTFGRFQP
ncbi:MAG: hypothetical protein ACRDS0_19970 [Pseudonocardiaceae bacterium]